MAEHEGRAMTPMDMYDLYGGNRVWTNPSNAVREFVEAQSPSDLIMSSIALNGMRDNIDALLAFKNSAQDAINNVDKGQEE